MKRLVHFVATLILLAASGSVLSEQDQISVGGDLYVSGSRPVAALGAPRDVFLAGFSPTLSGENAGDVHIAGFNVSIGGVIGQDLYVAGANVSVSADIREDLTASGFTVDLNESARIEGNARIAAATVTLNAPVAGSLVVSGGDVLLNSVVEGDVRLSAASFELGPDARILGTLTYSAVRELDIPSSVVAEERVRFITWSRKDHTKEVSDSIGRSIEGFWPDWLGALSFFLLTLGFLVLVGAILLGLYPKRISQLRHRLTQHPGKMLLAGFVGLSSAFGALLVSIMTLVGIPLIPFILLALFVLWTLAYLLAVHAIATKVSGTLLDDSSSLLRQLFVLALGLSGFALLNFIPVVGWLINLTLVLLGVGSMTIGLLNQYCSRN